MAESALSPEAALREAIARRDGLADVLDLAIGAPLVLSALTVLGGFIFLLAPDSAEPAMFAVIVAVLAVAVVGKIFAERRRKARFVAQALSLGVGREEATKFYETYDWEEPDAPN
jgi:hypothetical protein